VSGDLVNFAALREISKRKSRVGVRAYLDQQGIVYGMAQDGTPWTTIEAINRALLPQNNLQPNLAACSSYPLASTKSTAGSIGSTKTNGIRSRVSRLVKLRSSKRTTT